LANETYSNDQHAITQPPFAIHLTERRPREHRHRALVTFRRVSARDRATLTIQAGVERTEHFAFAESDTRTAALTSVSLSYFFR
jgi:predicted component of type VI protein secretion system